MKKNYFLVILVSLLISMLLSGCGSSTSTSSYISSSHLYNYLQYTLTTLNVVDSGNNVPITFTAKNSSSGGFDYYVSGPEVIVQVVKGSTVVWDTFYGPAFPSIVTLITIPAGEKKEYVFSWDQKDFMGSQVLPGNYTIVVSFLGYTEQIDITIR